MVWVYGLAAYMVHIHAVQVQLDLLVNNVKAKAFTVSQINKERKVIYDKIGIMNELWGPWLLIVFLIKIPLIVFNLYLIMFKTSDIYVIILGSFWVLIGFSYLSAVFVVGKIYFSKNSQNIFNNY